MNKFNVFEHLQAKVVFITLIITFTKFLRSVEKFLQLPGQKQPGCDC